MARVLASALVALAVWLPLALLTEGFRMRPGERIRFSSLADARQNAFADHGVAWPGSTTNSEAVNDGYVIQREWFGLVEVQLPLRENLSTDTARYESGPGGIVQQVIVMTLAVVSGALMLKRLRKPSREWDAAYRLRRKSPRA